MESSYFTRHLILGFLFSLSFLPNNSEQNPIITAENEFEAYPFIDHISSDPDDIIFYLYPNTALLLDEDQAHFDILEHNNLASIDQSRYNQELPVTILVHGFTQNLKEPFPQELVKAYLDADLASTTMNVIAVDWGQLSGPRVAEVNVDQYNTVVTQSLLILGQRISDFLFFLIQNGKLGGLDQVHLIGQSLGAHGVGYAGKYIQAASGGERVRRITGTDPAAPGFQGADASKRLDKSDADFVDVIHTDAGGYGFDGSLGHADFFVNGGRGVQPGCEGQSAFCSHNLATTYYAMSILNQNLKACSNQKFVGHCPRKLQATFGENCTEDTRGQFYLNLKKN